ncbi:hypothetical protein AAFP30_00280 [Gordonia sp. CPCC 205515]|uniref:hypothetical protein n=1 Tax=Gordonia sp. CPCC 205515 TaxID=3140791 RepID=UPI003AF3C343
MSVAGPAPTKAVACMDMSVRDMIDATPLGPILERPVGEVLAGLGLPPLPQLPALPPLPGLPPLPPLDLTLLIKPITDLLGAFGTGDLAAGGLDPSAVFKSLSTALEASMSVGSAACKALDKLWTGTASTAATAKAAQTTADTGKVATQGTGISIDLQAAAAIVGAGVATLQGIIAATISKIAGTVPILATPAGQALAVGFATEGLSEATAAVAATRAQLLGPTATMTANGAPVPITHAPAPGPSPFAIAGAVIDGLAPVVSSLAGLPAAMTPTSSVRSSTPASTPAHPGTSKPVSGCGTEPSGAPAGVIAGAGGIGGAAGAGIAGDAGRTQPAGIAAPGVAGLQATPLSAARAVSSPLPGTTEPAGYAPQQTPRTPTATPGPVAAAMAPVGAKGTVRGAAASNEQHILPEYLVTPGNGRCVVGSVPDVAPAVLGHDAEPAVLPADIGLRLGPPPDAQLPI